MIVELMITFLLMAWGSKNKSPSKNLRSGETKPVSYEVNIKSTQCPGVVTQNYHSDIT